VHLEGQVPEVAALPVLLRIPVVGKLEEGGPLLRGTALVAGRRKEDKGIAASLVLDAPDLLHAELVAVEIQARLDAGDSNHRVQIPHSHAYTSGSLTAGHIAPERHHHASTGATWAAVLQRWPMRHTSLRFALVPRVATAMSQFCHPGRGASAPIPGTFWGQRIICSEILLQRAASSSFLRRIKFFHSKCTG